MAYRVNLAQRAERDLDLLYEAIGAEQTGAALKWYRGLKRAVFSLEENPLLYRVIYRVFLKTKTVQVLHIRHGAMDEFSPEELSRDQ